MKASPRFFLLLHFTHPPHKTLKSEQKFFFFWRLRNQQKNWNAKKCEKFSCQDLGLRDPIFSTVPSPKEKRPQAWMSCCWVSMCVWVIRAWCLWFSSRSALMRLEFVEHRLPKIYNCCCLSVWRLNEKKGEKKKIKGRTKRNSKGELLTVLISIGEKICMTLIFGDSKHCCAVEKSEKRYFWRSLRNSPG